MSVVVALARQRPRGQRDDQTKRRATARCLGQLDMTSVALCCVDDKAETVARALRQRGGTAAHAGAQHVGALDAPMPAPVSRTVMNAAPPRP